MHSTFSFHVRHVRWALLLAMLPCSASSLHAEEAPDAITYQVKVGFIFNFLRFTEWPESALGPEAPIRVAVASDEATFQQIFRGLAGRTVGKRPIVVERADGAIPTVPPQLLFVTRTAPPETSAFVQRFASTPVLTVGESAGFARGGGIVNFVLVDEAVRFEINLAAAQRAGVRISSRVSKIAILVRPES